MTAASRQKQQPLPIEGAVRRDTVRAATVPVVFNQVRVFDVGDGRTVRVCYGGERYGWHACDAKKSSHSPTPIEALAEYLGGHAAQLPPDVHQQSESLVRELAAAPRYVCRCCGYRTLLNRDQYESCPVCGWEDDPSREPSLQEGGPNGLSLDDARDAFVRFGVVREDRRRLVRDPRPEDLP